jgi:two-component system nitrogen regulation response regulator GlnG
MSTQKTVLLADDDASILTVLTRAMKLRGYEVMASEHLSDVDSWVAQGLGDVVLTDVTMPRGNGLDSLEQWRKLRPELPVIVMSAHNTLLYAARAQDLGAVQFLPKPFGLTALMDALEAATNGTMKTAPAMEDPGIVRISDSLALVGKSPAMQQVFRGLANLIGNDLTVMITGESGTGKELIANTLHVLSRRKAKPFVALNMAAIPQELIESALFGHEKGAFTGAHQAHDGAFVQANGGTLFLDEIGDMPMAAQTRLLRVLQEREVVPVGATQAVPVDVRIVAATHRDLKQRVARGEFREDLYFRLHVVPLALPALRDRPEDISLLVRYFMQKALSQGLRQKPVDDDAIALLSQQLWPGNVRELEHFVYRLCTLDSPAVTGREVRELLGDAAPPSAEILALDGALAEKEAQSQKLAQMPSAIESFLHTQFVALFDSGTLPEPGLYDRLLASFERPLIQQTLRATGGNQVKAAEILGINRNTLRKRIRDLGLETKQKPARDVA